MVYEVVRSVGVANDLEHLFDFLFEAARSFGDDDGTAFAFAEDRIGEIETNLAALGKVPHQGTIRPHLGRGIRNVTKDRAVFYFDVDDERGLVRVLAVFFGGQDHEARILEKLRSRD